SAAGGIHLVQGPLTLDLNGRDFEQNTGESFPPDLAQTGFPGYSKQPNQFATSQDQTLGVNVTYMPLSWWRNSLTAGIDRNVLDLRSTGPVLATPADTFLTVEEDNQS